jgi:DNA-binding CsgD family transcriptional regulator
MDNIKNYPYFSYNQILSELAAPFNNHVNLVLQCFRRSFQNKDRYIISSNEAWAEEYYSKRFYQYGLFERDPSTYISSYNMWDHLGSDPNGIYDHIKRVFSLAHGLTIIKQHGNHCDFFLFATISGDSGINNFYINNKELFEYYIEQFYSAFSNTLQELATQTFNVPGNTSYHKLPINLLSPRQQDCIDLLSEGFTSKEIAKKLHLSPRTIEEHINILKKRYQAKNRLHLLHIIRTKRIF